MKKTVWFLIIFCYCAQGQSLPFTCGVNLTNWFQTGSARQIQFTKYTKRDFENIKSLGVDVVRLPINLHAMTSGAPQYTLDPLFLYFLDQVVDWSEELHINLILDNHSSDGTNSTDTAIGKILIPVWTQMAEHFKNRSLQLFYEVLNEPNGISDSLWNKIQQEVVAAIRSIDTIHTIIVGPANWNSYYNLASMPLYSDTNLIYTFHFYDPFIFTHQGASWSSPPLDSLAGVPFPYNSQRMPSCPSNLIGTWIQTNLQYYSQDGTVQKIHERLNVAKNFSTTRNVPVYCGEFGVYMLNSPDSDRVYWYEVVRTYLEENGIPWTSWDYQGGFGLFKKNTDELFDHDLNVPLLNALGFNVPPQTSYVREPDSSSIELYTDYIQANVFDASYSPGVLDYYDDQNPHSGKYCIHWSGAQRYQAISFDFKPNKDLSFLKANGYAFCCWVKGDNPSSSFAIRFVDSKTSDPNDHPWRMWFNVDNSILSFNNEWHLLQIPLSNFSEQGAWDNNTWYNPIGLFDWTDVDRFEIVAEEMSLANINFWFDDIGIINPSDVFVDARSNVPEKYNLSQNYPNPFNPTTNIEYALAKESQVTLKIYDVVGREIATLVDEVKPAGNYKLTFDATRFSAGVYFARLRATSTNNSTSFMQVKKLILLK
jgi:endoglucanase